MQSTSNAEQPVTGRRGERGFTLVEALIAIVILSFGLMAVSNLLVVAAMSNSVANRSTAATALAVQQMERLKATSFDNLVPGGDVGNNVGATNDGCTTAVGTYNCQVNVAGVGVIVVRWQITPAAAANSLFIRVRAEATARTMGARTRAEFTTFRVRS